MVILKFKSNLEMYMKTAKYSYIIRSMNNCLKHINNAKKNKYYLYNMNI